MVVLDHGAAAAAAITQRYLSAAAAATVSPPPPVTTAVSASVGSSSYLMQTSSPYVQPLNDEVCKVSFCSARFERRALHLFSFL